MNDNDVQTKVNYHLHQGDCLDALKVFPDASVHLCVTDPPYFLHHLDDEWTAESASVGQHASSQVKNLRGGMKFDTRQGPRFQSMMAEVSREIHRVLKPGGFYISFSQARLYHRLAIAVEDAGFELRDMLAWQYEGQPKAMSMDHFIERRDITGGEKATIIEAIGGRKTAMLKPMLEPMTLAQKPIEGTYVDNWMRHGTGLVDVSQSLDGRFPGNLMGVRKPSKAERAIDENDHPTVKPVPLIDHIIRLFSTPGQVVLDPFLGSGSHGVAAVGAGRSFFGMERDPHYIDIARKRMAKAMPRLKKAA